MSMMFSLGLGPSGRLGASESRWRLMAANSLSMAICSLWASSRCRFITLMVFSICNKSWSTWYCCAMSDCLMRMSSRVLRQMESILGVKKPYLSCPKREEETAVDMKINKIMNKCLKVHLIRMVIVFPIAKLCDFYEKNATLCQFITLRRAKSCGWSGRGAS